MTRQRIIERLRAAANLMLKGGYLKGKISDGKGAHCALGAIYATATHLENNTEVVEAVANMVTDKIPAGGIHDPYNRCTVTPSSDPHRRVFAWNNNIANSAEDVACVMRATAELLEEEDNDEQKSA